MYTYAEEIADKSYQYSVTELATLERPAGAALGRRYDYIGDHIALALAERVEALVAEMAKMNGHLAAIAEVSPKIGDHLIELVEATKSKR